MKHILLALLVLVLMVLWASRTTTEPPVVGVVVAVFWLAGAIFAWAIRPVWRRWG